jgi:hypothetical protein
MSSGGLQVAVKKADHETKQKSLVGEIAPEPEEPVAVKAAVVKSPAGHVDVKLRCDEDSMVLLEMMVA